jgi:hypothetical protein
MHRSGPGRGVIEAAWGKANDHAHRPRRISCAIAMRDTAGSAGSARGQMQELSSVEVHGRPYILKKG